MTTRRVTKHPGSKKPSAQNFRGQTLKPLSKPHKGYHEKPGQNPRVIAPAKKGAVWRACTRPLRRLPGWQKRSQNGDTMFGRPGSGTEASE